MGYLKDEVGKAKAEEYARAALNSGFISYSDHAEKRMKRRDLTKGDINNVLNRGKVTSARFDEERRCHSYLISTKAIQVPVSFKEVAVGDRVQIASIVISCWRLDRHGRKAR